MLLVSAVALAQPQTPASQKDQKDDKDAVTLAGCVSPKPPTGKSFTFTAKDGTKYRLTGKSMKKYAGQEVEIVSGKGKKLAIKGGLLPSPNVAAQAGALDPAQVAIARLPGGADAGTGGIELPELNVARVRGLGGSCQ
jgi:hypothetical protein